MTDIDFRKTWLKRKSSKKYKNLRLNYLIMGVKYFLSKLVLLVIRFIPSGTPVPVLKGPLRKFKWIAGAYPGSGKGLSVIFNSCEPEIVNAALKFMNKKIICFDIGANVGLYTLLFAKYSKFVYAFEPIPRNIKYLYETIQLNKIKNVLIVPCAISNSKEIKWMDTPKKEASFKLVDKGNYLTLTISLDEFIEKSNVSPRIIKIDVEGAEYLVLKGGKNFLLKYKPIILLSTHSKELKHKCFNLLKKLNYQNFFPLNAITLERAYEFLIKP
ncbi:MAG: FkbM family methyltransferase [Promethearchaeota archaeon]|nr:MAG: FkbM family methyltransferase [Candidatus Lokiarchaeota archaeon]